MQPVKPVLVLIQLRLEVSLYLFAYLASPKSRHCTVLA